MSRGAKYTCQVHGFTDCHAMSDGFYCLGDGAGPDDVCGLKCDFPMQMEDGRIYRTPAELLAGERTDPGPGKAFPRRGRGIVVKQRPRQKAANGPPARPGAPRPRTTNHETPVRPAPEGAAEAKENVMPEEKRVCEQCLGPMAQVAKGQKRCRECIDRMPSAIWCGFKNDHPDLDAARVAAAKYTPRRKGKTPAPIASVQPPPLLIEDDGEGTADGLPVSPPVPVPFAIPFSSGGDRVIYNPDIEEKVAPARGLLARVEALEQQFAQRDAVIAELRRVVLGESA